MSIPRGAQAKVGHSSGVSVLPVAVSPLGRALLHCAAERASGVLHVTGEPGGSVHLADGRITAISTPGAPDPEAILLRSGRVQEAAWLAAFAGAAPDGRIGAELVRRELIGAGELEALLRMALADAMFALAAGQVEGCQLEPGQDGSLLPVQPATEPDWLLAEVGRRIQVLALLPNPIVHDRDRVTSVPGAWTPRVGPGDGQAEILALANGRRTARDIAFVLGRGVYAVTLQLARMCDSGLLVIGSSRASASRPPAPDPGPAAKQARARVAADAGNADASPPLPRRRRSSAASAASRPPPSGQASSGQASSGQAGSRQASSGQASSGQASSGQASSEQAGSRQAGSRQAASKQSSSRPSASRQPERISVLRILRPGSGANREPDKETP